jgi:DNA-binding PucR family transcriptional regulator
MTVAIGVSSAYAVAGPAAMPPGSATRAAALPSAYRQATACAHLAGSRGGGTVRADELGPLRFLLDAPDISQVRAAVAEQLGPLLAQAPGRTDLLATLRAFVAADGNVAETARACFIHKNTLRYRLKRLTEILGRDPSEPEAKFHLRMAFDLAELFAGIGIELLPQRPEPDAGRLAQARCTVT